MSHLIPTDPYKLTSWWGGIWLGASIQPDQNQLRVYINLRHGDVISRWQRIANLLAPFADQRLVPVVREWMESAAGVTIPVGVGAVLTNHGLPVVRIYLGVERPGILAIRAARGSSFAGPDNILERFCASYVAAYGPFHQQSMTFGYDFARDSDGLIKPCISRFKVDTSFGHIASYATIPPADFISRQIELAFLEKQPEWEFFQNSLAECFGGSSIEYVSLSTQHNRLSDMTIYARPHGHTCS